MPLTLNSSATNPAPESGALFTLATRRKHAYGERQRVMPHDAPSGHEQHEWRCQCCPLVKITVLPQGRAPYRAYRFADGCQFEDEREPECGGLTT